MKYLKTYENFYNKLQIAKSILFNKYKVGDYIKFIDNEYYEKRKGKITKYWNGSNAFSVDLSDGTDSSTSINYILRKLTPKEIKQYELEKNSLKYNL